MISANVRRRRVVATLALTAAVAALPAATRAQTAPAPAQGARRRRVRDTGSVLTIGGIVAAIAAWVFIGGRRARNKEQARQQMEERLARARERSKHL